MSGTVQLPSSSPPPEATTILVRSVPNLTYLKEKELFLAKFELWAFPYGRKEEIKREFEKLFKQKHVTWLQMSANFTIQTLLEERNLQLE